MIRTPHCETAYYNPRTDYTDRREALQELLFEFADICQRNDIRYWLIEGALLGQFRTGTLIPWDEDLDVGMLRADFEKICRVVLDHHEMRRWGHNRMGCLSTYKYLGAEAPVGLAGGIRTRSTSRRSSAANSTGRAGVYGPRRHCFRCATASSRDASFCVLAIPRPI